MIDALVYGLLAGGVLALIAVGLTLIFGVMDIVNFAHGEFVMIGMLGTATITSATGMSVYLAALISALVGVALGLLVYFGIIRWTLGKSLYVQVFATFGLSILLVALATMVFGTRNVGTNDHFASTPIELFGIQIETAKLIAFGVGLAAVFLLWLVLHRTRLGRQMRAVSQDTYAAQVIGIRPGLVYAIAFTIGIVFASVAGSLIVATQVANPNAGTIYTLTSFVIVVLGGFGSVPGALLGGLIIGVVQSLVGYYLGTEWQQAALFTLFVIVLLVRPQGIFGQKSSDSGLVGG